jgi:hypothetical protein
MLTTPLAFDCSANEMSSALLELPSFAANITVTRRGPSLEGAYFWYLTIVSDVSMESTLSPLECYGQDLKGVGTAVFVTEINPHSLNYGLQKPSPLPGIANDLSPLQIFHLFFLGKRPSYERTWYLIYLRRCVAD